MGRAAEGGALDAVVDVLVVGAGLAGLVAARELRAAGLRVHVVEQAHRVGGRVGGSRHPEGFMLDDGFQVLFDAYPTAARVLNLDALDLRAFDSGAMVYHRGAWHTVAAPWRHPFDLPGAWSSGVMGWSDGLALARVTADALGQGHLSQANGDWQMRTDAYLHRQGLSEALRTRFLQPFFAGITLTRDLGLVATQFLFYWRMLLLGRAVIPAQGMQAIPEQVRLGLPADAVSLGQDVQELVYAEGRVSGVRTCEGRVFSARRVVLATPHPVTARLTGQATRLRGKGALTLYFAAREVPGVRPIIYLAPDADSPIGTVTVISNAARGYAPEGWHLVSVQALPNPAGTLALDPEDALRILAGWFPQVRVRDWRFLRACAQPFGQFSHEPDVVLDTVEVADGLVRASETLVHSSIEGAVRGGLMAARAVLDSEGLRG